MRDTLLITVAVPVYQSEKYLRRGLDSLLRQRDGRWEARCISDGLPDNSDAILEEYARNDTRFRIFQQENRGVSAARNLGLARAKGLFVTFMACTVRKRQELLATELLCRRRPERAAFIECTAAYWGISVAGHKVFEVRWGVETLNVFMCQKRVMTLSPL